MSPRTFNYCPIWSHCSGPTSNTKQPPPLPYLLAVFSVFVLADDLDLAAVVLGHVVDVDAVDVLVQLLPDLEVLIVHNFDVVQVPRVTIFKLNKTAL